MTLLFKYLKFHWKSIIIIIALFYSLASCDLALPDYMSRLINNGIINNGITDNLPRNHLESSYQEYLFFLDKTTQDNIGIIYSKIESTSATIAQQKKYPALKSGKDVYLLNSASSYQPFYQDLCATTKLISHYNQEGSLANLKAEIVAGNVVILDIKTSFLSTKFNKQERSKAANYLKEIYLEVGLSISSMQTNYIVRIGAQMLLIALATIFISTTNGFFISRLATKVAFRMRRDVFDKASGFSNAEYDFFATSSLITRTTSDIQQVQNLLATSLRTIVYAPVLSIGGIIKILSTAQNLAWIIGIALGFVLAIIFLLLKQAMPKFIKIQKQIDRLNRILRQVLIGQLVVRAFNNEELEEKRFASNNQEYTKTTLSVSRTVGLMTPLMNIILNSVTLLIVWFAAKAIETGSLDIGTMISTQQYALQIINSFIMISALGIMLPRVIVSLKRIKEVLNHSHSIVEKENPLVFDPNIKGFIEFKNVFFRYPNAENDVLREINLTINPGETVAFVGSTGSGKSTLLNLLTRFYEVSSGQILVDGIDIREVSTKELRNKFGYIPQKAMLFSGTIRSNLQLGSPDSDEEAMIEALKIAQLDQFVLTSKAGLDMIVAQGGTNFSGGQRQRLSIARAIVKHPEFYLLDDTFSALDYQTDAALRKALYEETMKRSSTILIVAQRIASILHADKIIVLEKGKIIDIGTHNELLKKCSIYYDIAASQLSLEDIEK